jgi:hypothetical protein
LPTLHRAGKTASSLFFFGFLHFVEVSADFIPPLGILPVRIESDMQMSLRSRVQIIVYHSRLVSDHCDKIKLLVLHIQVQAYVQTLWGYLTANIALKASVPGRERNRHRWKQRIST